MAADGSYIPANVSRESWINVEIEVEQSMQSYLDSLDEELSNQPGFKKPPTKIVRKCRTTSQTDPDSGYINHGSKRGIGYLMEATVDCKHGILHRWIRCKRKSHYEKRAWQNTGRSQR